MRTANWLFKTGVCVVATVAASVATAQDWPQWRGPGRSAAADFTPPDTWPQELTQKWDVEVGEGVATPSLVGDRLYVFSRQGDQEVTRCLNAATGDEIWKDSYASAGADGAARSFSGPRSSPAVADGKVVTLGVRGVLSCLDAESGEVVWRNEDYANQFPRFFTSSSPVIVAGKCIAQVGGSDNGALIAVDLGSGEEAWKQDIGSPAYGSPALMAFDDEQVVITPTEQHMVAVTVSGGEEVWRILYSQGRYNSATPIVDGQTLYIAGPGSGITALQLAFADGKISEQEKWRNTDNSVQFNTPVLTNGKIVGLSSADTLFCIDAESGDTQWTAALSGETAEAQPQSPQQQERGRRGGRGGRGGGRGRSGYGSVVAAGPVMMALSPSSELVVFDAAADGLTELGRYKVGDTPTYAYPVPSGARIFIEDQDSVTLFQVD